MKYTNIVFDIDGTLIDTEDIILNSLQKVLKDLHNRNEKKENLRFALGITGPKALEVLRVSDNGKTLQTWNEYMQNSSIAIKLFAGIEEVLKKLKYMNIKLGLITSRTRDEYEKQFIPVGISEYFENIVCSEDTLKHKPNGEPMRKYLEISNTENTKTLYIGDSTYDMQCALAEKTDCALALWGCSDLKGIKSTYTLKSPEDIFDIIKD
ncbi:MAG TPA: HAD family hydrolase [Petrotogaceae bacterium]|jgi:HAD superfamily hydrolase (TIGR01549 family)|nr:HAD family hydrolase [Petrotogaceae bacterium]HQO12432.1 HAD family hydrolase [Petrotogaceae bacterium]HQP57347.1 HAD family hydrolase [Petrotogaceae bacterium]